MTTRSRPQSPAEPPVGARRLIDYSTGSFYRERLSSGKHITYRRGATPAHTDAARRIALLRLDLATL